MTTTEMTTTAPLRPPLFQGGLPFIGALPWMRRDALGLLLAAKEQGDVVQINFGVRKITLLASPTAVERALVTNVKNYVKQTRGYAVMRKLLGNGLVTSEGNFWLRQRRIAAPAFHREKIAGFAVTMQRCTDDMLARWGQTHLQGGAFDVDKEMMSLTMRIAGLTLLSTDVDENTSDVGAALTELVERQVFQRVTLPFELPMSVPTPMNRRFTKARHTLDDIILGIIRTRRAGASRPDLLSMLMDATDEETGESMSDRQLRDEVMTLFLAGHETTASSLGFTLWLLSEHPEIEAQVRQEIQQVCGEQGDVDVGSVMRMPYLDAVFSEAMRVLPPVPLLARRCNDGDVVDGFAIPPQSLVFLSPYVTHRLARWWKNPARFDPTRFLEGGEAHQEGRPKYAYFPFAGGPRKCIGDVFARLEQKVCMARMLQRVRFTSLPEPKVEPMLAVSIRARHGIPMTVARSQTASPA